MRYIFYIKYILLYICRYYMYNHIIYIRSYFHLSVLRFAQSFLISIFTSAGLYYMGQSFYHIQFCQSLALLPSGCSSTFTILAPVVVSFPLVVVDVPTQMWQLCLTCSGELPTSCSYRFTNYKVKKPIASVVVSYHLFVVKQ